MYVKLLTTGEEAGVRADESFNSASVIKLPVLAGAMPSPLASKASCVAMLGMMRQQLAGARRLPHYLDVPVAHKTGDWPPYLANDVGIVYTKSGPVVISFCANGITGSYGEAEDRIGEIARLVVNYFDGGR